MTPISEWAEVTDYSSAEEAEEIALLLAKERIDLYLLRELSLRTGAEPDDPVF